MALALKDYITVGVRSLRLYEDGQIVEKFTHLKTGGTEDSGEVVKVKGGDGNGVLYTLNGSKESKITFTSVSQKVKALALLTGQGEVIESTTEAVEITENLDVAGNSATLAATTAPTDLLVVYANGKVFTKASAEPQAGQYKYDKTSKAITFSAIDKVSYVEVTYEGTRDVQIVAQNNNNKNKTYKLVADFICLDKETETHYLSQFVANRAKLDPNFSTNATNDVTEPEAVTLAFDLAVAANGESWRQVFFEDVK